MTIGNEGRRFGPLPMAFHWAAVACVVLAWLLGVAGEGLPKSWEAGVLAVHISLGLVVLALLLGRLGLRAAGTFPPPLRTPFDPWIGVVALAVQVLIYALLLTVPLSGIILQFARGQPLPLFGLWEIASPWPRDRALARSVKEVHELAAHALLLLATLHALAALAHHYLLRDDTLRRMLPRRFFRS